MRAAIIGAGLQGARRANALMREGSTVSAVVDLVPEAAQKLASQTGAQVAASWQEAVKRDDVDIVIVCTPPNLHEPIAVAAAQNGKHCLVEKPLARTVAEAERMVAAARAAGTVLKCGFNLRNHPVMQQIKSWVDAGEIGELFYIRGRYGTGGRPGYDQEWRAKPEISGGGQLMDQGIHLIDLARWFLGEFPTVEGSLGTYFWQVQPLEDNAFMTLNTATGQTAFLHASWTQWKPIFSFEVTGRAGYVTAEGLGGAYGPAVATLSHMDMMAPFSEHTIEYRGEDRSWVNEWAEIVAAVNEKREPSGSGVDGLEAVRIAETLYKQKAAGR